MKSNTKCYRKYFLITLLLIIVCVTNKLRLRTCMPIKKKKKIKSTFTIF